MHQKNIKLCIIGKYLYWKGLLATHKYLLKIIVPKVVNNKK